MGTYDGHVPGTGTGTLVPGTVPMVPGTVPKVPGTGTCRTLIVTDEVRSDSDVLYIKFMIREFLIH